MANKFYAVKKGFNPGIYNNWAACKKAVSGFSGAIFKSFKTKEEAQQFFNSTVKTTKDVATVNLSTFNMLVYTDGGCRNHGNKLGESVKKTDKAAWAFLVADNQNKKIFDGTDGKFGATNNQMELTAVIKALRCLIDRNYNDKSIAFICDSRYVTDGINLRMNEYVEKKFINLKNADLWRELYLLLKEFNIKPQFYWTRGHSTNQGNIYVDTLLNQTMNYM